MSLALVACGSDSTNPGPQPDAKVIDGPVTSTPDAGPDAATFSATIALNSVSVFTNPEGNATNVGQGTVTFNQVPKPLEHVDKSGGPLAPCSASSLELANATPGLDEGNVTFSLNTAGAADAGVAPSVVTCSFNSTSNSYDCGDVPSDIVKDGDTVHVSFTPKDSKFTAYNNSFPVGGHLVVDATTFGKMFAPDLSGNADMVFNSTNASANALALVVVIDASDSTALDPAHFTDFTVNATKVANITCATVDLGGKPRGVVVPKELLKVLANIAPKKLRVAIFNEGSDVTVAGSNKNIVVGQGITVFTVPPAPPQ